MAKKIGFVAGNLDYLIFIVGVAVIAQLGKITWVILAVGGINTSKWSILTRAAGRIQRTAPVLEFQQATTT